MADEGRVPSCPNCGGDVLVPGSDHYIGGRWKCAESGRVPSPDHVCTPHCDERGHYPAPGRVSSYSVEASDEDEWNRTELRRYPDRWVMVRMRRHVDGGWYDREALTVTAPASTPTCCDDGPPGHTQQEHHDGSACFDLACRFDHPHGGPFPHPCD